MERCFRFLLVSGFPFSMFPCFFNFCSSARPTAAPAPRAAERVTYAAAAGRLQRRRQRPSPPSQPQPTQPTGRRRDAPNRTGASADLTLADGDGGARATAGAGNAGRAAGAGGGHCGGAEGAVSLDGDRREEGRVVWGAEAAKQRAWRKDLILEPVMLSRYLCRCSERRAGICRGAGASAGNREQCRHSTENSGSALSQNGSRTTRDSLFAYQRTPQQKSAPDAAWSLRLPVLIKSAVYYSINRGIPDFFLNGITFWTDFIYVYALIAMCVLSIVYKHSYR